MTNQYKQAVAIVTSHQKATQALLQRKLKTGYNAVADLLDRMEAEGIISHRDHAGKRQVLKKR